MTSAPVCDRRTTAYTGPRSDVVALVPACASRILDVGCSDGSLGVGLKARGAEVWGIEYNEEFASAAAKRLDRIFRGDAVEALRDLEGEHFDAVVCADVLEHLSNPEEALRLVASLVRPAGRVVVSLPNVRYYTTFTELAFCGRWPRKDRGVHDRTHKSWFTERDAIELFAAAGFKVCARITHYRLVDSPTSRLNRMARFVARGPLRPFLAYQHVFLLARGSHERAEV